MNKSNLLMTPLRRKVIPSGNSISNSYPFNHRFTGYAYEKDSYSDQILNNNRVLITKDNGRISTINLSQAGLLNTEFKEDMYYTGRFAVFNTQEAYANYINTGTPSYWYTFKTRAQQNTLRFNNKSNGEPFTINIILNKTSGYLVLETELFSGAMSNNTKPYGFLLYSISGYTDVQYKENYLPTGIEVYLEPEKSDAIKPKTIKKVANTPMTGIIGNAVFVKNMHSTDGVNFISNNLPENAGDYGAYGNGMFVSSGRFSTSGITYSPDFLSLSEASMPSVDDTFTYAYSRPMIYAKGLFIYSNGAQGYKYGILYSPNGISWTQSNAPSKGFSYVKYFEELGLFMANSYANLGLYTSSDGKNWTQRVSSGYVTEVLKAGNYYYISPESSAVYNNNFMASSNGTSWTNTGLKLHMNAITYDSQRNKYYAALEDGLYQSTNGTSFSKVNSTIFNNLYSYNGIVIGRTSDATYICKNGSTWSSLSGFIGDTNWDNIYKEGSRARPSVLYIDNKWYIANGTSVYITTDFNSYSTIALPNPTSNISWMAVFNNNLMITTSDETYVYIL